MYKLDTFEFERTRNGYNQGTMELTLGSVTKRVTAYVTTDIFNFNAAKAHIYTPIESEDIVAANENGDLIPAAYYVYVGAPQRLTHSSDDVSVTYMFNPEKETLDDL